MSALAIAGAIILAALPLALIAFGLLHYLRIKEMSLLQDAEAVLGRIEGAVEAAAAPLHEKIKRLESDLETALGEKGALLTRLEQFGEHVVGLMAAPAAPAAEAAPEQPAS